MKTMHTCSSCSWQLFIVRRKLLKSSVAKSTFFFFCPFFFYFSIFSSGKGGKLQNTARLYLSGSRNYISNSSVTFDTF